MTFLPGKRYLGYYSGPHWRDLDSDAASLRQQGIDLLVLLVEDKELRRCQVTEIAEVLPAHGVELLRFPIVDPELPDDGAAYRRLVADLVERIRAGTRVAIACRGGLDRTGMTAGCLLREAGLPPDVAIERVHAARRPHAHTSAPDALRRRLAAPGLSDPGSTYQARLIVGDRSAIVGA